MTEDFRAPRPELPDIEVIDPNNVLGQIDLCFVIDTTSSMGAYIEEAKRHAREEAERVAAVGNLNIRYLLVEYRDHPPQDASFVTRTHVPVDATAFQYALNGLQAQGGGDGPEAVWDGLKAAADIQWRAMADRLVFVIGDSPPHGVSGGYMGDYWPGGCPCGLTSASVIDALLAAHVRLNAHSIAGVPETTRAFDEVAVATGGTCTVVDRPQQATAAYASTMHSTVGSVADSRTLLTASHSLHSRGLEASAVNLAAETGMPVESVNATTTYLRGRGIELREDLTAAPPPPVLNITNTDESK